MKYIFISLVLFAFSYSSFAENGKTVHVVSHNKTKVITDPSKGVNAYKHWSVFPSKRIMYRRAMLFVTYQCPESLHCGEWDYIDNIYLRRIGG
ncbi:MAG TPA: peptide-N-glycosidase, partial [Bacteroidota bacterium]|nr:peptide-N-glycosidase [Bacteroidota bacterium]